jgi:hypothetical protein
MANWSSLPLELREMIYEHYLTHPHDMVADGIPPLFKVRLSITRELYSHHDIITTIPITHQTPTATPIMLLQPLLQLKLLFLVDSFETKKEKKKNLIVVFTAVAQKPRSLVNDEGYGQIYNVLDVGANMDKAFRSLQDNFVTETKAIMWALELRFAGVDVRLDRETVRTGRDLESVAPRKGRYGLVWH